MSKIADATARPWGVEKPLMVMPMNTENCERIYAEDPGPENDFLIAYVRNIHTPTREANARLIVQAVNEREPLREMLFRALVELSYVQNVENCEGGLCASAEGKSIIEEGMKLLGVKDLSEDALKGEHNAD